MGRAQDQESCAKYLGEMRTIMFGDGEQEPDPSLQTALVTETHKVGLIPRLIALLPTLFFETRKDAAATFNALIRFPLEVPAGGKRLPFIEFLTANPSNLVILLKGSELVGTMAEERVVRRGAPSTIRFFTGVPAQIKRANHLCACFASRLLPEKMNNKTRKRERERAVLVETTVGTLRTGRRDSR